MRHLVWACVLALAVAAKKGGDAFDDLVEWVNSNGGQVGELLVGAGGHGLYAARVVQAGDVLAEIPLALMMQSKGDTICDSLEALREELRKGDDSFFAPMLQMPMPDGPIHWPKHVQEELQGLPPASDLESVLQLEQVCCPDGCTEAARMFASRAKQGTITPLVGLFRHDIGHFNVRVVRTDGGDVRVVADAPILAQQELLVADRDTSNVPAVFRDRGVIESLPHMWWWKQAAHYFRFTIDEDGKPTQLGHSKEGPEAPMEGMIDLDLWVDAAHSVIRRLSVRELVQSIESDKDQIEWYDEQNSIEKTLQQARAAVHYRLEFKRAMRKALAMAEAAQEAQHAKETFQREANQALKVEL